MARKYVRASTNDKKHRTEDSGVQFMSIRRTRWLLLFCAASVVFCMLAGCKRSNTVSLSGTVTLDGTALPTGTISLIPMDKEGGPGVGSGLSDGRYQIPAEHGPRRGVKYRVEIRSVDPSSGSTSNPLSGGLVVYSDRVPPAYNSESTLTLAVPDDAGNLQKDFNLQTKVKQ
jgi:hypothetical protein